MFLFDEFKLLVQHDSLASFTVLIAAANGLVYVLVGAADYVLVNSLN